MQVWASKPRDMPPKDVGDYARRVEALGYDGLTVSEGVHDGSVNAWAALAATTELRVAVSVFVAFSRSPMSLAYAAWDLQDFSGGRFVIGLGTQVKANIEQRFSVPWTPPVPRMREYVQSLRAIFDAWAAQDGTRLRFEGEHYRFTRMQPFFTPALIEHPEIPIYLGAVGPGDDAAHRRGRRRLLHAQLQQRPAHHPRDRDARRRGRREARRTLAR